jgi:hypothetical protein
MIPTAFGSAGLEMCWIAKLSSADRPDYRTPADLEIRDTADLEICATNHCAANRWAACRRRVGGVRFGLDRGLML